MLDWITDFVHLSLAELAAASASLLSVAVVFVLLAMLLNGNEVVQRFRRSLPQSFLNIKISVFNLLFVVPLITFASTGLHGFYSSFEFRLVTNETWAAMPMFLVVFLGVVAGDFVGYWRHRIEHSPLLWPSHAVHHSDTEMTWLSLERFHPINRVTTFLLDNVALLLLGMPSEAIIANALVRHYYGFFIHADIPWTYGPLGKIFVSPVMHRWHHAADVKAFNTNYATVFSVWDRMFGTFRVPGLCDVPLGVTDKMEASLRGQLSYAFTRRAYPWLFKRRPAKRTEPAE